MSFADCFKALRTYVPDVREMRHDQQTAVVSV
jgi:hypothetical protein